MPVRPDYNSAVNLTDHFLIAMPSMSDPNFAKSLTYICEHNDQGALGVVVNRPIDMTLRALFEQIEIPLLDDERGKLPVYFGGPVQVDRGFVLHRPAGEWQSTLAINGETGLTTSRDILQAVGEGRGPGQLLVSLGYAGWAPGQLEQELTQNSWLTVAADLDLVFDLPAEERLTAAMQLLGIDLARLSDEVGHA
jgi:putative transcriptional regulator